MHTSHSVNCSSEKPWHGWSRCNSTVYVWLLSTYSIYLAQKLSQLEWMQQYLSALWGHLSGTGTCYSVCYQFWINVKTSFMKILHLLSLICSIFTGVDPDLDPQSFWIRFSLKHVYNQEVFYFIFRQKQKSWQGSDMMLWEKKKKLLLEEDKKCDPVLL